MTDDEMKLDMLVAELDYENRLLRARNQRLSDFNKQAVESLKEMLTVCHDTERDDVTWLAVQKAQALVDKGVEP